MENDIPKIDLPQDWVIGKLSEKDIGLLNLYANYPCRLKAGIFVLCLRGEVEASINLTQFKVEAGSFITILPGTIFQIHRMDRDLQIYFMGFSSDFINQANIYKSVMDMHYAIRRSPIIIERLFRIVDQDISVLCLAIKQESHQPPVFRNINGSQHHV